MPFCNIRVTIKLVTQPKLAIWTVRNPWGIHINEQIRMICLGRFAKCEKSNDRVWLGKVNGMIYQYGVKTNVYCCVTNSELGA